MLIYLGMDDTDNYESRGTGHIARQVAANLAANFTVLGVVRHQLLFDPRVPYTSHNSSASILLETVAEPDIHSIFQQVKDMMLADFQPGSDPGLCAAMVVPQVVMEFGQRAKRELVSQEEARRLAANHGILLEGLGGTEGGVIGALAAVGLAATGSDGRYVLVGKLRELSGLQSVSEILTAGVNRVETLDGQPVMDGMILADKLRPARRESLPVAVVQWDEDHWTPLKLD